MNGHGSNCSLRQRLALINRGNSQRKHRVLLIPLKSGSRRNAHHPRCVIDSEPIDEGAAGNAIKQPVTGAVRIGGIQLDNKGLGRRLFNQVDLVLLALENRWIVSFHGADADRHDSVRVLRRDARVGGPHFQQEPLAQLGHVGRPIQFDDAFIAVDDE